MKARLLQPDGTYIRASKVLKDVPAFSSQDFLMKLAEGKADLAAIPHPIAPEARPEKGSPPATKKAVAAD